MKKRITRLALGCVWGLASVSVQAVSFTWVPVSGSNDWNTPANWTPAGPPGSSSVTDTATIPAYATGVINYNSAGPTSETLTVQTPATTQLTINVSAPLTLTKALTLGVNTAGTNLFMDVLSGGAVTALYGTVTSYGRFDVEAGGAAVFNKNAYPAGTSWGLNAATIRGSVWTGAGLDGKCGVNVSGSLIMDGGSLDTDGLTFGPASSLLLADNGGRVNLRVQGTGIPMCATLFNGTYAISLTQRSGVITNEASLIVGGPNTFTHSGDTTDGTNFGGVARVTLSGGSFVQRGYTAVGDGRVGSLTFSGTVFRTGSDLFVGGGDYWGYGVPKPNVAVSGTVSIVAGSVTITNAPVVQTVHPLKTISNGYNGKPQFYISESTMLWEGQRIVFTNLSSQVGGLSTGVTYFVSMFRWNDNDKCFLVSAYAGGPSLGTYSGGVGDAQWVTQPAILSVGNLANFSYGSRMAPGTLDISGGSLLVDQLVATNGSNSVIRFRKGSLAVQVSTLISNSVPFVAGNGADAAVLALSGGTHSFADGLVINTNAVFALGGTNALGTAAVAGNVTLLPGAVLDCDFNASTNDCAQIAGTLALPASATLRVRSLDGTFRKTIPVLQATAVSGSASTWSPVLLNGWKYRAVVSGNQLLLQRNLIGTAIFVY